jgi:hypothetical protein
LNRPVPEKAIAATRSRSEHVAVCAESLPDRRYVDLERVLLNNGAGPYSTYEVILGDKLTG